LTDGIVQIELGGKIPFAIVGVVTTDIVSMQTEQSLIW